MDTVNTLKAARKLISDPANWTQQVYACDRERKPVGVLSDAATCWCSLGALAKVQGLDPDRTFVALSNAGIALRDAMGTLTIVEFNDDPCRDHAQVLAAFDKAIAMEEARNG